MSHKILPGSPTHLGTTVDTHGTNFAVSSGGEEVTLCLFDADGAEERLVLPERDGDVWHGFVPGVGQGSSTVFGSAGPTNRHAACATTPPSYCSTRTLAQSRARCGSGPNCSGTQPITPSHPARWTRPITCRAGWSSPAHLP